MRNNSYYNFKEIALNTEINFTAAGFFKYFY